MKRLKIVVCGSTGNQGRAVVRALLASGRWNVIALTSNTGSMAAQELSISVAVVVKPIRMTLNPSIYRSPGLMVCSE